VEDVRSLSYLSTAEISINYTNKQEIAPYHPSLMRGVEGEKTARLKEKKSSDKRDPHTQ